MNRPNLDDVRSTDPVQRLLEDSWKSRSRRFNRRELIVEAGAALLFLGCAFPLALHAVAAHHADALLAVVLVGLYALASRLVKFPIGAGYVVPSYLVLVPMLLLLPPGIVPLLRTPGERRQRLQLAERQPALDGPRVPARDDTGRHPETRYELDADPGTGARKGPAAAGFNTDPDGQR